MPANYAGIRVGTVHLTESVQKLPQELVIPNDQIRVLDSIGQGGLYSLFISVSTCSVTIW